MRNHATQNPEDDRRIQLIDSIVGWDRSSAGDLADWLEELQSVMGDDLEIDSFRTFDRTLDENARVPGTEHDIIAVDRDGDAVVVEDDGSIGFISRVEWRLADKLQVRHRALESVAMDHSNRTLLVGLGAGRWVGLGLDGTIELVEDDEQIAVDDYLSSDLDDYRRDLMRDPIGYAKRLWDDFGPSDTEDEDDLAA